MIHPAPRSTIHHPRSTFYDPRSTHHHDPRSQPGHATIHDPKPKCGKMPGLPKSLFYDVVCCVSLTFLRPDVDHRASEPRSTIHDPPSAKIHDPRFTPCHDPQSTINPAPRCTIHDPPSATIHHPHSTTHPAPRSTIHDPRSTQRHDPGSQPTHATIHNPKPNCGKTPGLSKSLF